MVPEQELTIILSFYQIPTSSDVTNLQNITSPETEEVPNINNTLPIDKIMEESHFSPSTISSSTAIFTFNDIETSPIKDTIKGVPSLPRNPPPDIIPETSSSFKILRDNFESKIHTHTNNKAQVQGIKTYSKKMSTAARLVQEATVSEKKWSSQPERVVEGTPPKPVSFFD
uniref:Reverse transcriptase domain-containing protein n=1 Tax=Parastrongyloides trichosuri TaxID=131310 RepID=A0A0N4ZMC4_PARTI